MDRKRGGKLPERIEGASLHYAPMNELGVVFLFPGWAKKHHLVIDQIRPRFPDCIAYQKGDPHKKPIRIEFEFRSKNFKRHSNYSRKRCDWVVCWEDNWPGAPDYLRIIELRKDYGLGFNVWSQSADKPYNERISKVTYDKDWSVSSLAHKGDLILFYNKPEKCFKDIFRLVGRVKECEAGWKTGNDFMGPIRRVCHLEGPVFWRDLKRHPILKTSNFVRSRLQGRPRLTEYWPYLFDLIIERNPSLKGVLGKYLK